MAKIEDIAVGDTVTVKFVVNSFNTLDRYFPIVGKVVGVGAGVPYYGLSPDFISKVEKKPVVAGDKVFAYGQTIEVLKVRGDTAIVLWPDGEVSEELPVVEMTKVAA